MKKIIISFFSSANRPCIKWFLCGVLICMVCGSLANGLPIVVTAESGSMITDNSATISGSVNANGLATQYWFRYGTNASNPGGLTGISGPVTGSGNYSANLVNLLPNTVYLFQIVAENEEGTSYGYFNQFETLPTPPAVSTLPATVASLISVQLNGFVTPDVTPSGMNVAAEVFFQYGRSTSYGSQTSISTVTASGNFSQTVSGLTPNSSYHFRIAAYSSGGNATNYGADAVITTPDVPGLSMISITNIGRSSVQVGAYLVPNGGSSTVSMEYGTNINYGRTTVLATGLSSASTISANVAQLMPGTIYHYVITASNPYGLTNSSDAVFSTFPLPLLGGANVNDGSFMFALSGQPGSTNIVQYSTDFSHWLDLSTNIIPSSGLCMISNFVSVSPTQAMFRVIQK